jgi:hypothetical protein
MNLESCIAVFSKWSTVFLWLSAFCGIAVFITLMYSANKSDNPFRLVDLILEGDPPRASLNKLTLAIFALLSVWVVVIAAMDNKIDPAVSALLLGVLGIFVVGRLGAQGVAQFAAWSKNETTRMEIETREPANMERGAQDAERPIAKPVRNSSLLK